MKHYFEDAAPYLKCFYQPVYNVGEQKINAAEALLRYEDGCHNSIEQVIRKAEKHGCVRYFDMWILKKVLVQLPELKKLGIERVNVNLSPVTCSSAEAEKELFSILDEMAPEPSSLCFEITESRLIRDVDPAVKLSEKLMKRGFGVAIDDFGKEDSNLVRIMKIPFSVLKLDKEVIWSLGETEFSNAILAEIIGFVHHYGIQVTAEGIETDEQARKLADMRCDNLQGYRISRPLPFEMFCSFMAAGNSQIKNRNSSYEFLACDDI